MKALLYLMRKSFINYLKSLKKKPLKAIGPLFMILFIFLFLIPHRGDSPAEEAGDAMRMVFVIGFTLFTIGSLLYSTYKGTKKIKSYFVMSDVNLIFPSPIRPQTVLLYGLAKQIAMEILVSFWFIYEIPNILRNFNVPGRNQLLLIIAFVVFQMVFCSCLKLAIFALCARFKGLADRIRWAVKLLALTLLIVPGVYVYLNIHQLSVLEEAAWRFYDSGTIAFIPVIGWMKEMAYQSINQIGSSFMLYLSLFIALSALLIYIAYRIELDYYEDVLASAEENDLVRQVKSGNIKQGDLQYNEYQKKSPRILVNPLRRVRLKLDGVYGGKTLFYKHMNEYFKRGVWFINFYSLFLMTISIIYALTPVKEIKFILFAFCILLVYSALGNKVQTEIMSHYIYMIPDEPERKIFYGSISSIIKVCIDSLLLFIPSGIMMKTSILDIVLCILVYVSFGVVCTFSGLFVYKLGGKIGLLASPVLFSLFMLLFQSLMIVPNAIIVLVINFGLKEFGSYSIYLGMMIYNAAASTAFILGCRSLLDNMEQNSLY